jgi:RNA 2',3'-cyclic 3'-phosphodiesterase
MRLFIALTLPETVIDSVAKAQAELRRALPIGCVRWTSREQFHLTLRFLGDVEAERVEALKAALSRACESLPALQLRAEGIGFFPQNPLSTSSPPRGNRSDKPPSTLSPQPTIHDQLSAPRGLAAAAPFQRKPQARLPRVLWVGVKDSPGKLPRLQSAVEAVAADFTRERSEEFAGHVTLGRVKDLRWHEAEAFVKLVAGMAGRSFGKWTAGEVELIHSELLPDGPRYTTLAAVRLLEASGK